MTTTGSSHSPRLGRWTTCPCRAVRLLCCWGASGTSPSWMRRSGSPRRGSRRSCWLGARPGSGRPPSSPTLNAAPRSWGSTWRRDMVSTWTPACRSPRRLRRFGPSSPGSKTSVAAAVGTSDAQPAGPGRAAESGGDPCAGRPHRGRPRSGSRGSRPVDPRGHALGGPLDPGLRGHAVADRPRAPLAGADLPQRRAPSPPSVPEDAGRDQPHRRGPTDRSGRVGPRQHCRHRRRPHGRASRPVAGRLRAGAVRGQPALRRRAPGREPGRGPRPPLGSAVGPHRRPRGGSAGPAPGRVGERDPVGHRDARRAGGTRPGPDGGGSAGGAGRQRVTPGRRVPGVPASVVA